MKVLVPFLLLAIATSLPAREMLIIVSAPGNAGYGGEFARQATAWQDLAARANMKVSTIGLGDEPADSDLPVLEKNLAELTRDGDDLWLVWIGHGSFDGRTANFNLRGKDLDANTVKELLKPFTRRLVILNLFSASYPFLKPLAGENRVVICSGRSGGERNYSRFGENFADSIKDTDADLDLDGSVSLLEATLHASAQTVAFYEDAQRVLQEHAVLDDNGDGIGTPAADFKGLRADSVRDAGADGATTREIYLLEGKSDPLVSDEAKASRAKIEKDLDALRRIKKTLPEDEYYQAVEILMREMAELYGK